MFTAPELLMLLLCWYNPQSQTIEGPPVSHGGIYADSWHTQKLTAAIRGGPVGTVFYHLDIVLHINIYVMLFTVIIDPVLIAFVVDTAISTKTLP